MIHNGMKNKGLIKNKKIYDKKINGPRGSGGPFERRAHSTSAVVSVYGDVDRAELNGGRGEQHNFFVERQRDRYYYELHDVFDHYLDGRDDRRISAN